MRTRSEIKFWETDPLSLLTKTEKTVTKNGKKNNSKIGWRTLFIGGFIDNFPE